MDPRDNDSYIQERETPQKVYQTLKKVKKAGRDSEAFYNYLLPGVPRATRPAYAFVKIWSFGHENIATTNHPLPLIPVKQLSAGRLVQEQCG